MEYSRFEQGIVPLKSRPIYGSSEDVGLLSLRPFVRDSGILVQLSAPPQPVAPIDPAALARKPEVSVRTMASLVAFLVDRHGEAKTRELLSEGALTLEEVQGGSAWLSVAQSAAFFTAVRGFLGSDEAFVDANGYRAREAMGPAAYLSWAARPGAVMDLGFRSLEFFSRVANGTVVARTPGYLKARYTSSYKEPRVLCLARVGAMRALPTIWGLPPAAVHELSCIGWGDECCEYELTWREPVTHTLALLGGVLGAIGVAIMTWLKIPPLMTWPLPIFAAAVGHFADLRVRRAAELRENEELRTHLTSLTREADEARREFVALSERERDWLVSVESELESRDIAWREAMTTFEGREKESRGVLRAVSHDLASPIMVLQTNIHYLRMLAESGEKVEPAVLDELGGAAARVEKLLEELNGLSWGADKARSKQVIDTIEVANLADRLDRRIHAFALGRKIRTSVLTTRTAPESIDVEMATLDRVLDNLLTNALKYTSEGSVIVELSGVDDFLVVQISDTGRGIAPDMLEKVFQPEGSNPAFRAPGSRGIGLSLVVRLTARLGGRVEVMSRLNKGTTFWVYVPLVPPAAPPSSAGVLRVKKQDNG